MNAKTTLPIFAVITLLLSACAGRAPATVAIATQAPVQEVIQLSPPVEAPAATEAPAVGIQPAPLYPTQAPTMPSQPGIVPTPVDNYFRDFGINPYTDAFEDHLSTFSLDVDTASYTWRGVM